MQLSRQVHVPNALPTANMWRLPFKDEAEYNIVYKLLNIYMCN
jgi:hypothetical protein